MTKKDHVAIAKIIDATATREHDQHSNAVNEVLGKIVLALADYCQDDNPLFDRNKFIAACGY
jgi:hypothetical protein